MNIKIEILKACIFMLIGAFLCKHFNPSPKPQEPKIEQKQSSKCIATIKKITKPDGSIDEVTEFLSENSQDQKIKSQDSKPVHQYGIGLFNDKSLMVEARIGSMPLFLMGEGNLKGEAKLGLKIEF